MKYGLHGYRFHQNSVVNTTAVRDSLLQWVARRREDSSVGTCASAPDLSERSIACDPLFRIKDVSSVFRLHDDPLFSGGVPPHPEPPFADPRTIARSLLGARGLSVSIFSTPRPSLRIFPPALLDWGRRLGGSRAGPHSRGPARNPISSRYPACYRGAFLLFKFSAWVYHIAHILISWVHELSSRFFLERAEVTRTFSVLGA